MSGSIRLVREVGFRKVVEYVRHRELCMSRSTSNYYQHYHEFRYHRRLSAKQGCVHYSPKQ